MNVNNRFFPWPQVITFLGVSTLVVNLFISWSHGYDFSKKVEQPLRQAVFAKNINDCQRNIDTAVAHLKGYGLKKTRVHFAVDPAAPSFQVWYNNLVEIQEGITKFRLVEKPLDEQLFISLIRDRLMIEKKDKFILILPPDYKTYPYTKLFERWFWISMIVLILGLAWKKLDN